MYLSSILYSRSFVMFFDVPLGFFDCDQLLSHHFQRNNKSCLTEKRQCFCKMHISEHAVWGFFVYFHYFLCILISSGTLLPSLSLVYSLIYILKSPVSGINFIIALLLPIFKNWNLFLMCVINIFDYAYCPSYDHGFSIFFNWEKITHLGGKYITWQADFN